MAGIDIFWNVVGGAFIVSVFFILYLVKRGALEMIDDETKVEGSEHE